MKTVALIFPHQLFEDNHLLKNADYIFIIEDYLYFRQYNFHKQKLVFHRASMKAYEASLRHKGYRVIYIESKDALIRKGWSTFLTKEKIEKIVCYEVIDMWLEKDIREVAHVLHCDLEFLPTPMFINSKQENTTFFQKQKKPFMKTFYEWQRKRLNILVDDEGTPFGGAFSFDTENRKKLPKNFIHPPVYSQPHNVHIEEAKRYVGMHFKNNYGLLDTFKYAIDTDGAKKAFHLFLKFRLEKFGDFEDALSSHHDVIHHSVLTPYLNSGLLTPQYIVKETLAYAQTFSISLNSLEGFIRQIIGWREFMRAMYDIHGSTIRTSNFFKHRAPLEKSFWRGETGNAVVDDVIRKVIKTGYCHHIERLMVLGNYMLLSEKNPHDVYVWFMELFIDSYDWVMVPNVYSMSQYADGGLFATKPYISASNYIIKMSDYTKDGVWNIDFDTKFWNFLKKHKSFFSKNVRFRMLLPRLDKK